MSNQGAITSQDLPHERPNERVRVGFFEINESGRFELCATELDKQECTRSRTSSVYAAINSTPDTNSMPPNGDSNANDDSEGVPAFPKDPRLQLHNLTWYDIAVYGREGSQYLSEMAFFGTGSWEELKKSDLCFPWRVEAVTQEDVQRTEEDLQRTEDVQRKFERNVEKLFQETQESPIPCDKPMAVQSKNFRKWRHGPAASGSVTESVDASMPGMTEGSSRDTDSICLSECTAYLEDNRMDIVLDNVFSFEDEISQDFSAMPRKLELMQFDMFEDQSSPFGLGLIPRRIDRNKFPKVRLEESGQQGCLSPRRIDSSTIPWTIREEDIPSVPDSESSDSDSVWMSDYSESVPALDDEHPFLRVKSQVMEEALRQFEIHSNRAKDEDFSYKSAPADVGETSTPYTTACTSSSIAYLSSRSGKKRSRGSTNSNGEDEKDNNNSEDGKAPTSKRGRTSNHSAGRKLLLACPYAKKDAIKYRSCYAYTLKRTQDVKQHLSRHHQLPIYCGRCKEIFKSESDRDVHLMTIDPICAVRDIVYEGVTREQKDLLIRRVSRRMALEDQWFSIFDVLFPNHMPRPKSPYVNTDLSTDLEAFLDMMVSEGPKIISSTLEAHNISFRSISNPEHDLSSFLEVVIAEGLQNIADKGTVKLTQNTTALDNANIEDSIFSRASRRQAFSEQSGSSSDTLVASRAHSQQPAWLANQFGKGVETTLPTASIVAGELGQERCDKMVSSVDSEMRELTQVGIEIQYSLGELPAGHQVNETSINSPDNRSNLFDSQQLFPLDTLFEESLLFGPSELVLDDEQDASVIAKVDYESFPSYDD